MIELLNASCTCLWFGQNMIPVMFDVLSVGGGRHPNEGHQAVADVFDVWNMVERWQRLFRAQVTNVSLSRPL